METILNLIWLAITVAAVWLWRFRWSVSRKGRAHTIRIEAVAMVCVLALLFPVISLTDDLHPETVAVDAASGKRNACLIAASAAQVRTAPLSPGSHSTVGLIPRPAPAVHWPSILLLPYPPNLNTPIALSGPSIGRSPPSLE
jgi:hypothetical protein